MIACRADVRERVRSNDLVTRPKHAQNAPTGHAEGTLGGLIGIDPPNIGIGRDKVRLNLAQAEQRRPRDRRPLLKLDDQAGRDQPRRAPCEKKFRHRLNFHSELFAHAQ